MDFFIQQIVSGMSVGSTYALVALGFVLIFGVLNILNIAHAQTIMITPMSMIFLVKAGIPLTWAALLALAISVLFGVATFYLTLKPFLKTSRKAAYLAPFIATFGLLLFVENFLGAELGSEPRSFPTPAPRGLWIWWRSRSSSNLRASGVPSVQSRRIRMWRLPREYRSKERS